MSTPPSSIQLIPLSAALPLLLIILFLIIPFTPISWLAIAATQLTRGLRNGQPPSETARAAGRWIGLSIVLPWAAVGVLLVMVVVRVILAPVVWVQHVRVVVEVVGRVCEWLGLGVWEAGSGSASGQAQEQSGECQSVAGGGYEGFAEGDTDLADLGGQETVCSPVPVYEFAPLPSSSNVNTIRVLTLYPGPVNAPLRGEFVTITLPRDEDCPRTTTDPGYIYLSYPIPTTTAQPIPTPKSPLSPLSPPPGRSAAAVVRSLDNGEYEKLIIYNSGGSSDRGGTATGGDNRKSAAPGQTVQRQQQTVLPISPACAAALRKVREAYYFDDGNDNNNHEQQQQQHQQEARYHSSNESQDRDHVLRTLISWVGTSGITISLPAGAAGTTTTTTERPPLRIWTGEVCVDRFDSGERARHSELRDRILCCAKEVVVVLDAADHAATTSPAVHGDGDGSNEETVATGGDRRVVGRDGWVRVQSKRWENKVFQESRKSKGGERDDDVERLLGWVSGLEEEEVRRRLRQWWDGVGMGGLSEEEGFELGSLLGPLSTVRTERRSKVVLAWVRGSVPEQVRDLAWRLAGWLVPGLVEEDRMSAAIDDLDKAWRSRVRNAREVWVKHGIEGFFHAGVLGFPSSANTKASSPPLPPPLPPEDIRMAARAFFSQPWFNHLTSLQELSLPDLMRLRFLYHNHSITGTGALYLASLLGKHTTAEERRLAETYRLLRQPIPLGLEPTSSSASSSLLEILIATRPWHTSDPRDAIFTILNLADRINHSIPNPGPNLTLSHHLPLPKLYAALSAHLIRLHGPALFLSLLPSPSHHSVATTSPNIGGSNTRSLPFPLPSWAADFTTTPSWPNKHILSTLPPRGTAVCRFPITAADAPDDTVVDFEPDEDGCPAVMVLCRRRVVRGFFTRTTGYGHAADERRSLEHAKVAGAAAAGVTVENVRQLARDEVLVELHPGLAALLKRERGEISEEGRFRFVSVCAHALSREGVEKVVRRWGKVVVRRENLLKEEGEAGRAYLSLKGVYRVV
ncbi:hypothetical protein VTJ04DRAFT_10920 [Mycothermus thermophilus]|uniref:uncharacterized protein n=1 Tax=Humicola insolens TaxID=85995 RepID=UPI0037420387